MTPKTRIPSLPGPETPAHPLPIFTVQSYNIATIPGDGTGPEVTVEAMKVLNDKGRWQRTHFIVLCKRGDHEECCERVCAFERGLLSFSKVCRSYL